MAYIQIIICDTCPTKHKYGVLSEEDIQDGWKTKITSIKPLIVKHFCPKCVAFDEKIKNKKYD